ncbi:MAG: UvrB/UvrC motif-containing protein, partial [Opitutales bacterium]
AGTRHVGKVPKGVQARFGEDEKAVREKDLAEQLEKKIAGLEEALKAALEAEEFEECARLRDEIQTLRESAETSTA